MHLPILFTISVALHQSFYRAITPRQYWSCDGECHWQVAPLLLVRETTPRALVVRDTGIVTGANGNVCVCMFATGTSSDITATFKTVEWSAMFHQQQRYETYYSSVLASPSFPWSIHVSSAGQSVLYTN